MKDGLYVEQAEAEALFANPSTDYTRALLAAIPRLDRADRGGRPTIDPVPADAPVVVEGKDVKVWFPIHDKLFTPRRMLRAVDGVSFTLRQGETLGVVGESGSGKSTLARAVLNLLPATGGSVTVLGRDVTHADPRRHEGRAQGFADRLPGPPRQPRSAHDHRRFHRRAAAGLPARPEPRRPPRPRCGR